jgi:hypothetical protein
MFNQIQTVFIILLVICPTKQDDVHVTPGFTIQELSTDLAFESYAILNFGFVKPELSCYKWTQTVKLRYPNESLIHELEELLSIVNHIIAPSCHATSENTSFRIKRSLNWERFNPLSYAGWVTSRIFGYAHSFDLEQVNDRLNTVDQYIGTLKSTLHLVNQELFSEAQTLKTFENHINEQVSTIQSNFVKIEKVTNQIEQMSIIGFENLAHIIINLKLSMIINELTDACHSHTIPHILVSLPEYAHHIIDLEHRLNKVKLETVPGYTDHKSIIDLPMLHCLELESEYLLSVSVPIRRKSIISRHIVLTRIPFMFNNTICSYDIMKQHHVILNRYQEIVTATGSGICSQTGSGHCLFQLNQDFQPKDNKCLRSILMMNPAKQIIDSCNLICEPIKRIPYWISINDRTWGYLGPKQQLTINCLNQDPYNLTIGGISDLMWVTLPCNCYTVINGTFLFSPGLWCHDNLSLGAVPVKPLLEFSSVQIRSLQSHGLSEFIISTELQPLNKSLILSKLESELGETYSQVEEQLSSIDQPVSISHWTIGIGFGIILMILIVLCVILRAHRRSGSGHTIPVLGGLLSSLPGVRGESYLIIGSIIIMAIIQLIVLCVFLVLIYRLVLSLNRRKIMSLI